VKDVRQGDARKNAPPGDDGAHYPAGAASNELVTGLDRNGNLNIAEVISFSIDTFVSSDVDML
jgi:hypothetical protein